MVPATCGTGCVDPPNGWPRRSGCGAKAAEIVVPGASVPGMEENEGIAPAMDTAVIWGGKADMPRAWPA